MTENATAADETEHGTPSVATRLRALLRRIDPTRLGLLGLLSLPGRFVDSLAFLKVFGVFFLFFLWIFVGPLIDAVLARREEAETEPTDWIEIGTWRTYAVAYLMIPLTLLNPLVMVQDLLQAFGGVVAFLRHRGSLPDAESYEQRVSYRLPVEGTWTVVNGSPEREHSHSWIYPNQRYAYDFLITDEDGRSRPEGTSTAVENYYCYEEPVLAPADGVVVDAFDAILEASRGGGFSHPLKRSIPGGHVVIRHAESEYSFLAHFAPGSVTVEPGDRVARGEQVGRCGHSGNSSEPHLHFQIQDRPDFATAASLPVRFDDVTLESPGVAHDEGLVPGHDVWHSGDGARDSGDDRSETTATDDASRATLPEDTDGSPDGHHDRTFVIAGQRVTHAGEGEPGRSGTVRADSGTVPTEPGVVSTERRVTATLARTGFGLAVGGVVAYVATIFVAPLTVAPLLSGVGGAVLAARFGLPVLRSGGQATRTGWPGTPLGLWTAAAAVALQGQGTLGVGLATVAGVLVLVGFVGYVAVAEYDRLRLRDALPRGVTS